jgi:hypothetical protein
MLLPGGSLVCKLLKALFGSLAQDLFGMFVLSEKPSEIAKVSVQKIFHH